MPAASAIPSATSSSSSFSIVKPELQQKQFQECTMAHFNRAQFFFDPPHIQQQARIDRRFLQRLYREKSHATVHNFFPIDCDEEELPKQFQELYKKLNGAETDSTRVYQLIINTLTYYYSRLTWSTSVQKCVFTFLDQHLLKSFHSNLEARSQFELEMCCLIELFMLRYGADTANENRIYDILHQIRSKFGLINLSAFVHNIIINHFGYSLEPKLRSIFDRLDFKVKSYRSEPLFASGGSMPSSANKRKCSLTSLVSQEGASSEPTHSSSEEAQMGGKDNGGGGDDDDSSDDNPIMPMEQDEQLEEEEEAIEEAEEQEKSPPAPKVARRAGKAIKSHSPAIEINGIPPLVTKRSHKAGASTATAVKKNPASRSSPRGRATPIAKNPAKKNTKPMARTPVSSQAKKRRSSAGSQSTAMANAGTGASTTMTGTRVSARQLLVVRVHDVNKAASSIALLSPELLARYRRRMNAAKRQKGSADEIFYGRASMRRGLFERSSTSPADLVAFNTRNSLYKTTTTINDNNKQQQKSRSGRVIKSPTMAADDCVHIAHTLLNIHNKDPLSPPTKKKKGKTTASPMVASTEEAASVDGGGGMLRKLLKPAGRSARKKMEKLLRNNNKQQQQKRTNSAASNKLETSNGA